MLIFMSRHPSIIAKAQGNMTFEYYNIEPQPGHPIKRFQDVGLDVRQK